MFYLQYEPRFPLTLDVPVPRELGDLFKEQGIVPINCYITNTQQHQREAAAATSYAYDVAKEPVEVVLDEEKDLECVSPVTISNVDKPSQSVSSSNAHADSTLDSAHPEGAAATPNNPHSVVNSTFSDSANATLNSAHPVASHDVAIDSVGKQSQSVSSSSAHLGDVDLADSTLDSAQPCVNPAPISAHPDDTCVPRTPPHDDSEDNREETGVLSPPLLITKTVPRNRGALPEMIARKRGVASHPSADNADVSETTLPPPEDKVGSQADPVESVVTSASKESAVRGKKLSLSDSGSELSDNDWLDEDLLPRRWVWLAPPPMCALHYALLIGQVIPRRSWNLL